MSLPKDFATQQLAATGWAPIHFAAAIHLRPDLWGGIGMNARYDFAKVTADRLLPHFPGAKVYRVDIEGIGAVDVLARCPDDLANRMRLVLGLDVEMLPGTSTEPVLAPVRNLAQVNRAQERIASLRRLAAQDAPTHVCRLRSDILAARAELERMPPEDAKPGDGTQTVGTQPDSTLAPDPHEPAGALDRACTMVADMLKAGPRPSAEILSAAEGDGISARTMQRAADALAVVKSKTGFGGGWVWSLPVEGEQDAA